MKKRLWSILFCLAMIFATIPANAASSTSDISSRLLKISQTSGYTEGTSYGGGGCWNFVNAVSKALFGVAIPSGTSGQYYLLGAAENKAWDKIGTCTGGSGANSAVLDLLKQAQPGDIIQYRNDVTGYKNQDNKMVYQQHTALIYAVSDSGISIYDHASSVKIRTSAWSHLFSWNNGNGIGNFETGLSNSGLSLYRCNKTVLSGDVPPGPGKSNSSSSGSGIKIKVISADVKTTGADTITETSAILRGSFTTTGKRATECGMYLGTDRNNLTNLGLDSVNTFGTSMFYSTAKYGRTLTPGTTYYYQAYVIVNGSETKGSVESFITEGTPPTPTPALGVSLSSDSLTLKYGTCNKLSASTTPAALPVTWKSTDESVVTVTDGVVTAVSSGTADVIAEVFGNGKIVSAKCRVTVEAPSGTEPVPVDPDIKLVQSTATLDIGERTTLQAITTPADQTIGWSSSNEAVAVVDQSGIVTALVAGTATITACMEYNGDTYFALCGIVVKSTAPDVTLSVSSVTNIAQTTARVNASCAYGTGCRPSSVGLYLGTSPSSLSYWKSDDGITHNKNPFDIWYNLSDLSAGTTYYYQFYAKTDRGEVRSEVNSFTTESSAPTPVSNTRTAIVVNTNGQYLAINDRPAASPRHSNQIGRIPPSGTVTVYTDKTSGNWYYVEYNGVNGYAYSKYLSLR